MRINGRYGEYECRAEDYGWSFITVVVYEVKHKKFLGIPYTSKKRVVNNSQTKRWFNLQLAKMSHLEKWFKDAVVEYEDVLEERQKWYEDNK